MTTSVVTPGANNESALHGLIDDLVAAIRAKDIAGVMAVFAPDVASFDVGPPLQHGGGEVFKKRWQELFDSYHDPIRYEVYDLRIAAGADTAFSHSLNRIAGTMKDGRKSDRWLRWTACFRRIDGRWLIVHEHVSFPTDVKTGKAAWNLKP